MANKKQDWINFDTEDESHSLRDWFVQATIIAGANSVQKLMAVTYLSQFEDLEGEFATRPVFTPDFQVGIIPYSSELLEVYNDIAHRMKLDLVGDGQDLKVLEAINTPANIEHLLSEGAQLSRLYKRNLKTLGKFEGDNQGLFGKVNECYQRDRRLVQNLAYLTDPMVARPKE